MSLHSLQNCFLNGIKSPDSFEQLADFPDQFEEEYGEKEGLANPVGIAAMVTQVRIRSRGQEEQIQHHGIISPWVTVI